MFRFVTLVLTLSLVWVGGCSEGTDPSEIGAIGSAGGFLRSDFGPTLSVPPLALDNAVRIELVAAQISPPSSSLTALSTGVSVLPEKLQFGEKQYPLLTIPLDLSKLTSGRTILDVEVFVQRNKKWEKFTRFSIQEEFSSVVLQIAQTGIFAVFVGPSKPIPEPPAAPEATSEPQAEPAQEARVEASVELVSEPKAEPVQESPTGSEKEGGLEAKEQTKEASTPEKSTEPPPEATSNDGGTRPEQGTDSIVAEKAVEPPSEATSNDGGTRPEQKTEPAPESAQEKKTE